MEYRTLAGISTADIHDAFVDAFGSYEVPMTLSVAELTAMMDSRDVSLTLSVGCFDADTLVGFVLVGVRDGAHGCVTYDAATGVRQGHQNKGIGSGLLHALWAQLRAAGAVSFQLEVLENNTAAQTLYERHGCTTTRRFVCVRTQRSPDRRLPPGWELRSALPAGIDEALYNGYVPSWQQAVASARGAYFVVRTEGSVVVAYGIINATSGSVMQLGIHPDWRWTIPVAEVVQAVASQTNSDQLRFVNIEDASWMASALLEYGWEPFVYQREMMRAL
jgi:ribosomal protein S18 acetylase RimI-like enzyme